jgi:hypothetical protein
MIPVRDGEPAFVCSTEDVGSLWVSLLEKAFVKKQCNYDIYDTFLIDTI